MSIRFLLSKRYRFGRTKVGDRPIEKSFLRQHDIEKLGLKPGISGFELSVMIRCTLSF